MTDLTETYSEYLLGVSRYKPTVALSDADKFTLFKRGVRSLFTVTGRAALYNHSLITPITLGECPYDLGEDEKEYIVIAAKIEFYKQMSADVSVPQRMTQHRTDALSVTFSDKTVADLERVIAGLKRDLDEVYHRMVRFVHYEAGDSEE